MSDDRIHTLDFLLAFDGRMHWYEQGYFMKFEIRQVEPTEDRPHGLRYSFTLHGPDGKRLIGFDNAHPVQVKSRYRKRPAGADHWHRTETDTGRPYAFKDAETLIADFFEEAERVLRERGVSINAVKDGDKTERSAT